MLFIVYKKCKNSLRIIIVHLRRVYCNSLWFFKFLCTAVHVIISFSAPFLLFSFLFICKGLPKHEGMPINAWRRKKRAKETKKDNTVTWTAVHRNVKSGAIRLSSGWLKKKTWVTNKLKRVCPSLGRDEQTSSMAEITITIRDVNDEAPTFNQQEYRYNHYLGTGTAKTMV